MKKLHTLAPVPTLVMVEDLTRELGGQAKTNLVAGTCIYFLKRRIEEQPTLTEHLISPDRLNALADELGPAYASTPI